MYFRFISNFNYCIFFNNVLFPHRFFISLFSFFRKFVLSCLSSAVHDSIIVKGMETVWILNYMLDSTLHK